MLRRERERERVFVSEDVTSSSMENNTNGTIPKQLPLEAREKFTEGIYLTLSKWSALQLAVENEWGGRNSVQIAEQLGSDIFSWFTQTKGKSKRCSIL